MGLVETSGCVSLRPPHFPVASMRAAKKWSLWSLDVGSAFFQPGNFDREVYLRAPPGWGLKGPRSLWRSQALTFVMNDAPNGYMLRERDFLAMGSLRFRASTLYFVFRAGGKAVGGFDDS